MNASDEFFGRPGEAFAKAGIGDTSSEDDIAGHAEKVKRDFWAKLKRVGQRIPFVEDLLAAYYCAMDPATPVKVRGSLLAALAYFILPFDIVPDVIAGLGFTDDAALLAMVVGMVANNITPAHRAAAARTLENDFSRVD